jgi:hypothetical protein
MVMLVLISAESFGMHGGECGGCAEDGEDANGACAWIDAASD